MKIILNSKWQPTQHNVKDIEKIFTGLMSPECKNIAGIYTIKKVDWRELNSFPPNKEGFLEWFCDEVQEKFTKFDKGFYTTNSEETYTGEFAFTLAPDEASVKGWVSVVSREYVNAFSNHKVDGDTEHCIKAEFEIDVEAGGNDTTSIIIFVRQMIEKLGLPHEVFHNHRSQNFIAQKLETLITSHEGVGRFWYDRNWEYTMRVINDGYNGDFERFLSVNGKYKDKLFEQLYLAYLEAKRAGGIDKFKIYSHVRSPYSIVLGNVFGNHKVVAELVFEVGEAYEGFFNLREKLQKALKAAD